MDRPEDFEAWQQAARRPDMQLERAATRELRELLRKLDEQFLVSCGIKP